MRIESCSTPLDELRVPHPACSHFTRTHTHQLSPHFCSASFFVHGAGDVVRSSADRLASDFSRLQPPSAGVGRGGVASYMLAQR